MRGTQDQKAHREQPAPVFGASLACCVFSAPRAWLRDSLRATTDGDDGDDGSRTHIGDVCHLFSSLGLTATASRNRRFQYGTFSAAAPVYNGTLPDGSWARRASNSSSRLGLLVEDRASAQQRLRNLGMHIATCQDMSR